MPRKTLQHRNAWPGRLLLALVVLGGGIGAGAVRPAEARAQALDTAGQALVGTWESPQPGAAPLVLTLDAAGTGKLGEDAITWRAQGDGLTLVDGGETHAYRYTLSGSTLTVSGADLAQPLVFTKKAKRGLGGRAGAPTSPAAPTPPTAPAPPTPPALPAAPVTPVAPPALVGAWLDARGVTTEFLADGRYTESDGPGGTWRASGETLEILSAKHGQKQTVTWRVEGDRLTIRIGNDKLEYRRKPGTGPSTGAPTNGALPAGAATLIGAWEVMGAVTEFRADGTYIETTGPGGAWTVNGDVLILTSAKDAKVQSMAFQVADGGQKLLLKMAGATITMTRRPGGVGAATPSARLLLGVWESGKDVTEFRENGTFIESNGPGGRYEVRGDVLLLKNAASGETMSVKFSVDAQHLTLEIGAAKVLMTRRGSPVSGASAAPPPLVGSWVAGAEGLELRADGTFSETHGPGTRPDVGTYQVLGNTLVLARPSGEKVSLAFSLVGDELTFTFQGGKAVYRRKR